MKKLSFAIRDINNLLGKQIKKNSIEKLNVDSKEITDDTAIADSLNAHFTSIADKLRSQLINNDHSPLEYMPPSPLNSFSFVPATSTEVQNIIGKLKKYKK